MCVVCVRVCVCACVYGGYVSVCVLWGVWGCVCSVCISGVITIGNACVVCSVGLHV